MKTKHYLRRRNRALKVLIFFSIIGLGVALILKTFNDNIVFFFGPSDIIAKQIKPSNKSIRVGGLVKDGSIKLYDNLDHVEFVLTDKTYELVVHYKGILPNLFRENQSTVATGYLKDGFFEAKELLAKHDENYMPKEVAQALKESGCLDENINKK